MTFEHQSPAWLAAHCDEHSAFETACAKAMRQLQEENQKLREILLRHICHYRVDDDAYDPRASAQAILDQEMSR